MGISHHFVTHHKRVQVFQISTKFSNSHKSLIILPPLIHVFSLQTQTHFWRLELHLHWQPKPATLHDGQARKFGSSFFVNIKRLIKKSFNIIVINNHVKFISLTF